MPSNEYCLTPEQAATDKHMPPCPPPPPQAGLQVFGILPTQDHLSTDAMFGFILAAPCNSSRNVTSEQKVQVQNNRIKLLPKKSSYRFGDTYRELSARTA